MLKRLLPQFLVSMLWLVGWLVTFACTAASVRIGIVEGVLMLLSSMITYAVTQRSRDWWWNAYMWGVLPLVIFMVAHPIADYRNGVPQTWLSLPAGVLLGTVAAWGLWPRREPRRMER